MSKPVAEKNLCVSIEESLMSYASISYYAYKLVNYINQGGNDGTSLYLNCINDQPELVT